MTWHGTRGSVSWYISRQQRRLCILSSASAMILAMALSLLLQEPSLAAAFTVPSDCIYSVGIQSGIDYVKRRFSDVS